MTAEKKGANRSVSADWRLVISLGESLLRLERQADRESWSIQQVIVAQSESILEIIDRLLTGKSTLWFSRDNINRFVGSSLRQTEEFISGAQFDQSLSPLIQASLIEKTTIYGQPNQSGSGWEISQGLQVGYSTAIAIPLLAIKTYEGEPAVLGVCQIITESVSEFSPQKIEILHALVRQASQVLQNSLRRLIEHWRREQLSLVNQVSTKLADIRDLDELSQRVTTLIQKTFNYYYIAIITVEAGQEKLCLRASIKASDDNFIEPIQSELAPTFNISLGEGIVGSVALTGKEILANDVQQEIRYRHEDILKETRSEVALPLTVNERVLGVLDVQSDQIDMFDDTDMLVLRTLAGNIAVAIEGIRLFDAADKRENHLAAIQEVSRSITSILDKEELLDKVVDLIVSHFGYPHVHIFTVHPGRRKVFLMAGSQLESQQMHKMHFSCDLDDQKGLIPWVASHGETKIVNDVLQENIYTPSILGLENVRSELTVPLEFGGEVLGVLDIQSALPNAFDEQDRFLIETLADNIAIALRNAFLYRSEAWRRRVADSLREVAGLLSANVDLEKLLNAILLELERTLPLDLAVIWLLDENEMQGDDIDMVELHLAAFRGACAQDLDLEVGFSPQEVLLYNPSDPSKLVVQYANEWLKKALVSEQPIIRSSKSAFEPLGAAINFDCDYSAVAAPLRAGEQPLGVLVLAHSTAGRYGSESRTMTAAFASYAAVAIENMRLYDAAHEQAWVSTVLLQVAEATQSQTNLNELLATVIRITPMLVGVTSCLLYIFDEDEMFVPVVASGLTPEQEKEFERWRFAPGDVNAFDQLLVERRPVVLRDDFSDRRLSSILNPEGWHDGDIDCGLLVLVPMVARDQVLGAFLVDYSEDILIGMSKKPLEDQFDEHLAIIQGIAQQTAVAVDNIHLLKSQKEEAYISVALLQVAQAVVSSNDLDEALAAIVRVTPILVGVKRTAIFLWNEKQASFSLSQSYGIRRDEEEHEFSLGSFPLLDAVMLEESLFVCSLTAQDENSEKDIAFWKQLVAPDLLEVDELLENDPCLLLAFPLSVKGKLLGVFIVEEPDPVPIGGEASGNANRRLRDRRLEIVTGICQQAALAIQNELFQREMVERERLEREMQLARQIQTTFLPHKMKQITGWELEVSWRPAREVGGDFYDFFELPGKRLGFVIADVADKGLPAAMYMTLARTLVRAMVPRVISPGKVLDRVNDYLVMDVPQGMFVTLVYLVLSLKTGDLVFANAGHNPPLIVHSSLERINRLKRGGMALGVMKGDRIQEQRTSLKPGEFLILYTDGITEAFSPDGDMFGEERLHKVILDMAAQVNRDRSLRSVSAKEMLNRIESSAEEFMGGQQHSDDLTLLVLKRL